MSFWGHCTQVTSRGVCLFAASIAALVANTQVLPGDLLTGLPLSCWHTLTTAGFHGSSPLLWAAVIQKADIQQFFCCFHVLLQLSFCVAIIHYS